MPATKQYTLEEVRKSNDKQRTVLVIHDKVYDITNFLNEHPGGEEILLDHAGKDATEDFSDVGHSSDALELMVKYQVGEIVEAERRNLPRKDGWKAGYNTQNSKGDNFITGPAMPFTVVIGGIVLGALAVFYLLF